jgi:3-hydroxy-9,10-secoandrosta-1,3,5(10)-triene-9,17-dione monooxygenase reductase component
MSVPPDVFRSVLGHLPTGVTVLTAFGTDGPVGMAANSVSSVSLDPPMLLVCPATSSTTWPAIRESGRFCVNVMAGHHESVTRQFAKRDTDRFAGAAWRERSAGPALEDAVAWIECEVLQEHEAGDHTIVVAAVVALDAIADREPLVFFRGGYGTFAAHDPGTLEA